MSTMQTVYAFWVAWALKGYLVIGVISGVAVHVHGKLHFDPKAEENAWSTAFMWPLAMFMFGISALGDAVVWLIRRFKRSSDVGDEE